MGDELNIGLITIGAELLNGARIDTNAAWIGQSVIAVGGKVVWHMTVNDDSQSIVNSIEQNDSIKEIEIQGKMDVDDDIKEYKDNSSDLIEQIK